MALLRPIIGGAAFRCAAKERADLVKIAALAMIAIGLVLPGAVSAQQRPAEMPPPGFAGSQYVDSRGCAFGRVEINGQQSWVPRLGPDRAPLCGLAPSVAVADPAERPEPAETAERPTPRAPSPTPVRSQPVRQPQAASTQRTPPPASRPRQSAPVVADARTLPRMADIPTVPCPRHHRGRDIVCLERSVYEQLQATLGATATPRGAIHASQTGGRYVQVGTFAVPSNAQNTIARLQARGLPVARSDVRHRGQPMQIILTGPFDNRAAVHEALRHARAMGFTDAFIR